ncbi:MAG: 1-acyl-sn-glycerol-3-phosphate acyltransferase [Paludibacteraceae bacterium]|nr:1-acyl-sn-glycerol-3-phosphate acyltransferase [Paludibacteraceae bacterium]
MQTDNLQYQQMELEPGTFIPQLGGPYPQDDPFTRLYHPVYDRDFVVDEHYPFVNDSWRERWMHFWAYPVLLYLIQGLRLRLGWGMKTEGRKWLRKYRKQLKGGAITIANHCHRNDAEAVLVSVGANRHTKIPMFAPNFATKDQFMLRAVGGVPIPPVEAGMAAMKQFNLAFDEFHRRGWWFHVFPEAVKWNWYKPLRPFQKGAFTMAYKYNMPLVPCVIIYRKREWYYRLFGKKEEPCLTVRILEPILPDTTQPRKEEVNRLATQAHEAMERAAGILRNPWPPMEA